MNDETRRKVGLFTAIIYYHFLFVYLIIPRRPTALVYGAILAGIVSVVATSAYCSGSTASRRQYS